MRRKFWQGRMTVYSTVCSGLSAAYGSWNTICTRLWYLRSPPACRPSTASSPNLIDPEVGRSEPVIILAIVLLPLPLAPTRLTAAPGAIVNDTSSTAVNLPCRARARCRPSRRR